MRKHCTIISEIICLLPSVINSFFFFLPQIGTQFEVEKLRSWKGQIKSGGSLLLTSKVPLWVCFCVRRLRGELNPEPWQACQCSPTWTHAEWDPSARAALIPHWHTALSTTSNHRPLMHRKLLWYTVQYILLLIHDVDIFLYVCYTESCF